MFCPSCGSEEHQVSQFCRACGTDLRGVRIGLERPDSITASAITAREEIGRAVAEKIREIEDVSYMQRFANHVLPSVEKFLESPEEKRLRRLRTGTMCALIGLFVSIPALALFAEARADAVLYALGWLVGLALITLASGLGLLINGLLFSKPRKGVQDNADVARVQNLLDSRGGPPTARPNMAAPALRSPTTSNLPQVPDSVTEHTTLHLKSDQ